MIILLGLAIYWLGLGALLYRRRGFALSSIQDYNLPGGIVNGGRITQLDFSVLTYLPLIAVWAFSIYPTATDEYGLGYLGLAFIPAMAAMLLFTKRLWLLSARYGSIDSLLIVYFQSPQVQRIFALINLSFSIIFMLVLARAAGIFLHLFTNAALPVWLGITLALIFPSLYLLWGGLKGLLLAYKIQLLAIILGLTLLAITLLSYFFGLDATTANNLTTNQIGIKALVPFSDDLGVPPEAWNSLNFISFCLLFLALPCLSIMMNFIGATKIIPPIRSFVTTWVITGLVLAMLLPLVFIALQALQALDLGDAISSSSSSPQGLLSIFFPSFIDHDKSLSGLLLSFTEYKFLTTLIGLVVFSSLQLLGAGYLATTTATLTKNLVAPFGLPAKHSLITTLSIITFVVWVLAFAANIPLINLYILALALSCQTLPAIIGLTYWPFLTRSGVILGLLCGCLVVVLTEPTIFSQFGYELVSRFNIQSVLWGLSANFIVAIAMSFITTDPAAIRNKQKFHNFLRGYAGLPRDKRQFRAAAWLASTLWLVLAFTSVVLMSGYDLGSAANQFITPLIWGWQLLCWALGVLLLWFLAKFMEFAYCPYTLDTVALNKPASQAAK